MRLAVMSSEEFVEAVMAFDDYGTSTLLEPFEWEVDGRRGTTMKAINEYWTSGQRQANALHEISYRACFKPQLPAFFINRLTEEGDAVYDPFMGRGTTPLEARLLGRRPMGNDINPLSQVLLAPRLNPPGLKAIERRLEAIDLSHAEEVNEDLLHFFHRDTLREIIALKEYLLRRQDAGELDEVDAWIRMVAINRLTGHSSGFFSVYTLPPNQAVTAARQQRINEQRNQIPAYRAIKPRILKKSKTLLKDWKGQGLHAFQHDLSPTLTTSDSRDVSGVPDGSAKLVVTSPPFLDVVDYQGDNWMRCWFIGLDSSTIEISQLKSIQRWEDAMTDVLRDLKRIVEVGGHIAFEVGEVRGGKVLLEEHVVRCGVQAGLEPVIILINDQEFTKTANAWGVDNDKKGTNTNRIVLFQKQAEECEDVGGLTELVLEQVLHNALGEAWRLALKDWNDKIPALEELYAFAWKEAFPLSETAERTKMISPLLQKLFEQRFRSMDHPFTLQPTLGKEKDWTITGGGLTREYELKLTGSKEHSWTGNRPEVSNKENTKHLLMRYEQNELGHIVASYAGIFDLPRATQTKWKTNGPSRNSGTLTIHVADLKHLVSLCGEPIDKNVRELTWARYKLEPVS